MKQIYFHVDDFHVDEWSMSILFPDSAFFVAKSFEETWMLIKGGANVIHTTDISQLSFDLIDMGYEIYLCYRDKKLKIEPGMKMEHCEKEIRRGHNIRRIFLGGVFDEDLGIEFRNI